MKTAFLYIKSFLLVACVLAEAAMPLVLPEKYALHAIAEGEKETETSDKKEDLKGGEKVIAKHIFSSAKVATISKRRLLDHQIAIPTQIFLPILTPPPEGVA